METAVPYIIQLLMGVVMWFMKNSHDATKETLKELRYAQDKIKEDYFKKEDFREFKEELWRRLDKMESSFENKIENFKP